MISFITEQVYAPWSKKDIDEYERNGSQRDTVHYLAKLDARILLTNQNIFQCSIRVAPNKYKNIYLLGVKRNLFYFIIYVPQMDVLMSLKDEEPVKSCISKCKTTNNFINNSTNSHDDIINNEVSFHGGNCAFVKVNAYIGEFLFPRRGYITNEEILKKYSLVNIIYNNAQREFEHIVDYVDSYSKKISEQIEKREQIMKKMLIKKGIRVGISVALACATGVYMDLDTAFGFDDLADVSDLMDIADASDFADVSDIADWSTSNDILLEDQVDFNNDLMASEIEGNPLIDDDSINSELSPDDTYNVSFQGSDKTITVYQEGNSSKTTSVTAKKVAGTSNKWDIYNGNTYITTLQGILHGSFYLPGFGTAKF